MLKRGREEAAIHRKIIIYMGISIESPLLPSLPNHPQKHFVIPNETFPGIRGNGGMRDLPRGTGKYVIIVLADDECIKVLKTVF